MPSRVEQALALAPEAIIISPGPGEPRDAGHLDPARSGPRPAGCRSSGVCLGHQAIGEAFGGRVVRAGRLMHGKTTEVSSHGAELFEGLPNPAHGHAVPLPGRRRRGLPRRTAR